MAFRFFIFIILCCTLGSCQRKQESQGQKPTVLVSVPPYAYFVKKIAQDTVQIETLIPAGANPHFYETSPKEVQRHQQAALWIYLGEAFDKKVYQFFRETKRSIQILDITQDIPLLSTCQNQNLPEDSHHCHHSHEGGHDLHVWLSPKLAKIQAQKIAEALSLLLPEHRELFAQNLQTFMNELQALDQAIQKILNPFRSQAILVSHPAFAYFCQDYNLTQLSIEVEGKDPLPKHVASIIKQAKDCHIQSVLVEPQYSNKGAELIAKSLDLSTHMVDPYAENYLDNLLLIAEVIAQ